MATKSKRGTAAGKRARAISDGVAVRDRFMAQRCEAGSQNPLALGIG